MKVRFVWMTPSKGMIMLRGMQSGLGYGWNLGQKKLLEDQKKWGALK